MSSDIIESQESQITHRSYHHNTTHNKINSFLYLALDGIPHKKEASQGKSFIAHSSNRIGEASKKQSKEIDFKVQQEARLIDWNGSCEAGLIITLLILCSNNFLAIDFK